MDYVSTCIHAAHFLNITPLRTGHKLLSARYVTTFSVSKLCSVAWRGDKRMLNWK
jgi:hypothetical protein